MIPQYIMLSFMLITIGIDIERNGKEKTGKHNIVTTLIGIAVNFATLYWGNFFEGLF